MKSTNSEPIAIAELFFRLNLGLQKLNKRLEQMIGMSLVQWYVLRRLMEMPGVAAGALAKEIGVHPGTLTPLLQRLRRKGMLFVERDGHDFRRKTVLISREGRAKLVEIEKGLFRVIRDCSHGRQSESDIEEMVIKCNEYTLDMREE
jgi:DNA-binding MarR family transcriptional regulator